MVTERAARLELDPEPGGPGLTIRVEREQADALLAELRTAGLSARAMPRPASGAASALEGVLVTLGTPATIVAGAAAARALPGEAWTTVRDVLTALLGRDATRRVEIAYGEDRRIVVEGDRKAVRKALDELLPAVREHMDEGERRDGPPAGR